MVVTRNAWEDPPPILHNFFLQVTSHVFENDRKWEVDIFLYGIVYYTWV
jgi:hypothetical protein